MKKNSNTGSKHNSSQLGGASDFLGGVGGGLNRLQAGTAVDKSVFYVTTYSVTNPTGGGQFALCSLG